MQGSQGTTLKPLSRVRERLTVGREKARGSEEKCLCWTGRESGASRTSSLFFTQRRESGPARISPLALSLKTLKSRKHVGGCGVCVAGNSRLSLSKQTQEKRRGG